MESQKVRHIPIFVEGRDQPVINRGHDGQNTAPQAPPAAAPPNSSANPQNTSAFASAESSAGPEFRSHGPQPHFQPRHDFDEFDGFGRPPMGFTADMGFDRDIPLHHGSIFDRAKEFPVRDFFNMRSSPRRSESPKNHFHQAAYQQQPNQSRGSPGPQQQQPPRPQPTQPDRSVPVVQVEPKRASTPQRQVPPNAAQAPPPPDNVPAMQKAIEDSITKIQKIQQSVLDIMSQIEKYDGSNPKEYAYLDEMLTQNLLKLDNIDAEGKENIKNARREAIKCINSLISLLEAKKDAVAAQAEANKAEAGGEDQPTQNGLSSKNSSYDNVSKVQQTASNNSVNMTESTKSQEPEASLEAKVQEAMKQQEEQPEGEAPAADK